MEKTQKLSFLWKIKNFSIDIFDKTDVIESAPFNLDQRTIRSDWKLQLHPKGKATTSNDHFSLSVVLQKSYGQYIKAKYVFSLVGANNECLHKVEASNFHYLYERSKPAAPSDTFGRYLFYHGQDFMQELKFFDTSNKDSNEYLVDDALVILCELEVGTNTDYAVPVKNSHNWIMSTSTIETFDSSFTFAYPKEGRHGAFLPIIHCQLGSYDAEWLLDCEMGLRLTLINPPRLWIGKFYYLEGIPNDICASRPLLFSENLKSSRLGKVLFGSIYPKYSIQTTVIELMAPLSGLTDAFKQLSISATSVQSSGDANEQQESGFFKCLKELFDANQFSDIRINVDGYKFEAHKIILSARSSTFRKMLSNNELQEIIITDFDYETISAMLEYMYTSVAPVDEKISDHLLLAAQKYKLDGLMKICETVLMTRISIETAVTMLVLADRAGVQEMKKNVIYFIKCNADKLSGSDSFKTLFNAYPELAHELFQKVYKS